MIELTLENFEKEILNSTIPCVVAFKHGNCHLCRGLSVVLKSLSQRYDKQIKFVTIDTLDQTQLTDLFNVEGVPTIFLFIEGDGVEIQYPSRPSPMSGYSENFLINFLSDVISDE